MIIMLLVRYQCMSIVCLLWGYCVSIACVLCDEYVITMWWWCYYCVVML